MCREFRHTTQHGAIESKTQDVTVKLYNLDVIISVGFQVLDIYAASIDYDPNAEVSIEFFKKVQKK